MKIKSFQDYIWSSTLSSGMWIFVVVTGVCSLAAYFFSPNESISIKYVTATIFIIFAFISIAVKTAYTIYIELRKSLNSLPLRPKVIYARTPPKYYSNSICVLITEPTEILTNDSIVSIYLLVSQFEELIAIGKVINVQDDKKVQVLITHDHDIERYKNKIISNDKDILEKIVLKSTIPSFIIPGVFNFG